MIKELSMQPGAATTTKHKKTVVFKEIEEQNLMKMVEAFTLPPYDTNLIINERLDMERAIKSKSPKKYSEIIKQQFSFKKPVGIVEDKVT